jgi:hypothetical protein
VVAETITLNRMAAEAKMKPAGCIGGSPGKKFLFRPFALLFANFFSAFDVLLVSETLRFFDVFDGFAGNGTVAAGTKEKDEEEDEDEEEDDLSKDFV